jgi:hypothetical protein
MKETEDLDKAGEKLAERAAKMSSQLGNWTMAANAGGIAFVLTAARDPELFKQVSLTLPYTLFLVGLVMGFAGHVLIFASTTHAAKKLAVASASAERAIEIGTLLNDMEARGVPPPPELQESFVKLQSRARIDSWADVAAIGLLGSLFYIVAAALAAGGLAIPLLTGTLR